jgi:hypothetical protein
MIQNQSIKNQAAVDTIAAKIRLPTKNGLPTESMLAISYSKVA